ncbi:MAG: LysM peptidoglycan-binding domain-containing protein [bacterium]|nr:LysM peptidoglycan-binding domain-containing protein [bacterium]
MRQIGLKTWIVVIATIITAIGLAPLASASGGIGGRVTNPDPDNPRTNSIFVYSLKHGQTKTDQLTVINSTTEKQTISIGSVDGTVTNTGAYTCRQNAEPLNDSGGWVKLSKNKLTLKSGERRDIDFTVTVPQKADVGEHNSCLTLQSDEGESAGPGLHLRMRQAVRMAITIPGDLHRDLSIDSFSSSTKQGLAEYSMTVANKGNVSADVNMQVSLQTIFGREVDKVSGEYPVLPNENLSQNIASSFRPMFGGIYQAQPSISYDKRLGIYGTQNPNDKQIETKTGDSLKVLLLPTVAGWLIIIGLICAIVAAIWISVDKYQRDRSIKARLKNYTVKSGDSLQTLADESGTKWRDIARVNKISAPYTLKTGDVIKLPSKGPDNKS